MFKVGRGPWVCRVWSGDGSGDVGEGLSWAVWPMAGGGGWRGGTGVGWCGVRGCELGGVGAGRAMWEGASRAGNAGV